MQGTKQEPQALREFSSSTPEVTTNLILYDWLSFTSKKHTPRQLVHALGLDDVPWETVKGARGYKDRMYVSCISIHYNGRADMGVWVELTGQGCRTFESLSTLSNVWQDIFWFIFKEELKVTRLDVGGLFFLIVAFGTPWGGTSISNDLRRAGVVNHAGEAPLLAARYKDRENPRITILEFEAGGVSRSEWEDKRARIETALNART